jgi:PRTRC genetic system protein A
MNSPMDIAIQSTFPVCVAPVDGVMTEPGSPGTRYIATGAGLIREVSTSWMVRRKLIAPCKLPYGEVQESVNFLIHSPPRSLWFDFVAMAKAALPNESAALICWNETQGTWRLVEREFTFASPDRIDYIEPTLQGDELAVIDIHSHGTDSAFFSRQDNTDDQGGIKISVCVGKLALENPQFVMRLVVLDEYIPLQIRGETFKVCKQ